MLVSPLFFSSNMVFGRSVVEEVAPFTLAFLRWCAVSLALAPFLYRDRRAAAQVATRHWGQVVLLGVLGMWICGGMVYLALQHTTATNGTLIYTTSPVQIIIIEALFFGRRIGWREGIGSAIAFFGVAVIVLRGDPAALAGLDFNIGDLIFVGAALSWALYSIFYRSSDLQRLSNLALLCLVALSGAVLLAPAALLEWASGASLPATSNAWAGIAGIVVFSSLLAFSTFQYGVRRLGASPAGIFMYLLPVYGVGLAVLFLGEELALFHFAGIALVMGGIVLATFPLAWLRERLGR